MNITPTNLDNCSICLDEFTNDKKTTTLNCNHKFHYICVTEWINTKHTCPICRNDTQVPLNKTFKWVDIKDLRPDVHFDVTGHPIDKMYDEWLSIWQSLNSSVME